jgi:signal transduction histidine kinase
MTTTPRWQEALLPGELSDRPDGRRSARDWIVDALMYVIAFTLGALALADTWEAHGDVMGAVDIVLGVIGLVALWWRRSHPGTVAVLITVFSAISGAAAGPWIIAGFNVALRGTRSEILTVLGIAAIATQVYNQLYPNGEPYLLNLFLGALVTAVVIGWGLLARVGRQHVLELRERAARMQAEQHLRIEHARDAERRRIAREMHDVLAHRVSLLSLHAGALEFRRDASPEEVAEAAGVIRETARAALEDLRQVIGVLRDGSEGGAPEPPQPTLADVPALIEESRAAGMRVHCTLDVTEPEAMPAALGRTVYRIVQEGLTNARKHAPAAAVDVTITGGEALVVEIVSRRPVGVAVAARPLPGAGSGLIGLSERVALAGGELHHGPDASGDFVLRATLPLTP